MDGIKQTEEGHSEIKREFENALSGDSRSLPTQQSLHPAIAIGIGGFFILNVGLLLSLPPVLMGRGAPYLPTFKNKMDQMFAPLKAHYASTSVAMSSNGTSGRRKLTFVDLGSGDGRVVFRAAREGLFHKSIGYEINPCKSMAAFKTCSILERIKIIKNKERSMFVTSFSHFLLTTNYHHFRLRISAHFFEFSPAFVGELETLPSSTNVLFNHQFLPKESVGC
jgi:Histone methylation protein DOT1